MVPGAAQRPRPRPAEDARAYARRALNYGDANAERLRQAAETYQGIAEQIGTPAQ